MAGEDCAGAVMGPPPEGSARSLRATSSEDMVVGMVVGKVVGVVTALQTEWLAKSVRISFRSRRLR